MTTLVLTEVDDGLIERLRVVAAAADRTVEQQAKIVLEQSLPARSRRHRAEIAASIAAMTPKGVQQTDSVILLREDRARDDIDPDEEG